MPVTSGTIFGEVASPASPTGQKGTENLYPADAVLNLRASSTPMAFGALPRSRGVPGQLRGGKGGDRTSLLGSVSASVKSKS